MVAEVTPTRSSGPSTANASSPSQTAKNGPSANRALVASNTVEAMPTSAGSPARLVPDTPATTSAAATNAWPTVAPSSINTRLVPGASCR